MPIKILSGSNKSGKTSFRLLAFFLCIVVIVSSSLTVFAVADKIEVTVTDEDNSVTIKTDLKDPKQIVAAAGFNLDSNDELNLENFSDSKGGTIIINRAKLVRIEDNGIVEYIISCNDSIKELLDYSGIVLNDGDEYNYSTDVYDGMRLFIKRAFTVSINCDGKKQKLSVASGTVRDAIEKSGIKLSDEDIVSPSLDTPLFGFININIKRVSYKFRTETESIKYKTTTVKDSTMNVGKTKVVTKGKNGEKKVVYIDKYVDGELQSSEIKSEKVITESVNKVVNVGTKKVNNLSAYANSNTSISELKAPSSLKLNEKGIPTSYKKCISGKATAYTGDTTTATGITPKPGYIAVNPKEIPYGSELYVVSADGTYVYGYCIAADTGGFVKMGNTDIDLFMNNEQMCLDWGNRNVKIYVLS